MLNSFWYVLFSFLYNNYFFGVKEAQLLVVVDDLDFGVKDVFKARHSIGMAPLIEL